MSILFVQKSEASTVLAAPAQNNAAANAVNKQNKAHFTLESLVLFIIQVIRVFAAAYCIQYRVHTKSGHRKLCKLLQ